MAKQGISTGTTPNDGTGDTLLDGAVKINDNFDELYTLLGDGTTLTSNIVNTIVAGDNITVSGATGNVTVTGIGTADIDTDRINVSGVVTATKYEGSGVELTGIVTSITAGTNITVSGSTGNVTINASGGGGGSGSISVGYGATVGQTPYIVGTGVTRVDFVGAGYTVTVSDGIATVRNLKMDLKQINFTSAGYATTINEGSQISYTATVDD